MDVATTALVLTILSEHRGEAGSCFPTPPPRRGERDPRAAGAGGAAMARIADAFRRECAAAASDGLREGLITREALEALEPAALIGVPAFALFTVLHRSAERAPRRRALVCDGGADAAALDEAALPDNGAAAVFWPRLMRCKAAVERVGPLQPPALGYLRVRLLGGGGELTTAAQAVVERYEGGAAELEPLLAEADSVGMKAAAELVPLMSEINSLAIDVSRLRLAMDACADAFRAALEGGGGVGSEPPACAAPDAAGADVV